MPREEYSQLRVEVPGRVFHTTMFARAHASKGEDAELPAGRTLFVLNVPAAASESALRSAFALAGEVSAVKLSGVPGAAGSSSTHAAHVVFAAPGGLKKALKLAEPLQLTLEAPSAKGAEQKLESREQMQRSVDAYMRKFDADEKRREAEDEARHNQMDADGFVVVSSRKRGRSTTTEESTGATVGVASRGHEEHESATAKKKKKKHKGEL
eukprot:4022128-Prymnesium_polylepis.1